MRKISKRLVVSVLCVLCVACGGGSNRHRDGNVSIARFEKVIFDTPAGELTQRLSQFVAESPNPLLNIYPDNPQFIGELQGFVADPTMRDIYNITVKRYPDLYWLEEELTKSLGKAHDLYPDIEFDNIATFVSGYFDYMSRVLVDRDSRSILVSLDQYALGDMEKYSYFGLPAYLVDLSDSSYMATDIMASVARQFIASPDENDITMLDRMVMEGKVLYFLDKVMPATPPRLMIRYSDEQLEWCRKNESMIWTYFIQNNLLYEKDHNRYHNFTDDAPKTNAFKNSAPRTTDYIGWQIVARYMKNSGSSISELFANTDSQAILQASKYKP